MTEPWRIHPSLRGRDSRLESSREHDWELEDAEQDLWRCQSCGRPWISLTEPDPMAGGWCPQMQQGAPDPVSDRRAEKRAARGEIYGPLCDYVRGMECAVPSCHEPSDPAHVRSVGSGHSDWIVDPETGEKVGNVSNLCRSHHNFLDGEVGGGGSPEAFEAEYGVDVYEVARKRGDEYLDRAA